MNNSRKRSRKSGEKTDSSESLCKDCIPTETGMNRSKKATEVAFLYVLIDDEETLDKHWKFKEKEGYDDVSH